MAKQKPIRKFVSRNLSESIERSVQDAVDSGIDISELVDASAPAVVNITAKKEVSQRSSYGYGGIPDEMLERFGIPREFREMPQQKREAISYGSGFILKDNYIMTNFMLLKIQQMLLFHFLIEESFLQR